MDRAEVFAALKGGVECKTNKLRFKKFKHSFTGEKVVSFLLTAGIVKNREDGKRVGTVFMREGLIAGVTSKTETFLDEKNQFYRFCVKLSADKANAIVAKLKPKVVVKNRKYRMSTYRHCFIGEECIDVMIGEGIAKNRSEASQVGNALLMMSPPYIEHVTGDSYFQDDFFFFRFCNIPQALNPSPSLPTISPPVSAPKQRHHSTPATGESRSVTAPKKFSELYSKRQKLGEGAFSVVIEAVRKTNNTSYAIKIVTKSKLSIEDEQALKDEIQVLNELKHGHIIQLYDVFDERSYIYLVTELMSGGELFDRIVQKAYYNEKEARDLCKILFESIAYCHSKSVAHRDLKPENLLLVSKDDDSQMKIADFGFAKKAPNDECLSTQCGTPGYVAPEILEGVKYGLQADMWSLGVIVYILLGGYPPFIESTQKALFRKIRKGEYEFHEQYWKSVSKGAKDLIKQLLTVDPKNRITAEGALKNPWITGDDSALAGNDLGVNLAEFKRFNAKRKFKGAVKAVMLSNKMESLGDAFISDLDN